MAKSRSKAEFGDFQTPLALARKVCGILRERGDRPASVLEPTCGRGAFLRAAREVFDAAGLHGYDRSAAHLAEASHHLAGPERENAATLRRADFFDTDWDATLQALAAPVLVVGNPPWVTSAALGALGSDNLPAKSNLHGYKGLDALTGKSNFDVSEWMLIRLLHAMLGRPGTLAMLVKTAVARKVLAHAWGRGLPLSDAAVYTIDAARWFDAAVDACLLVAEVGEGPGPARCAVHAGLETEGATSTLGYADGRLLADVEAYYRRRGLLADTPAGWRSGVKHDCARVFELRRVGDAYENGFGEAVTLEGANVFPLLKSADVAHGRLRGDRYLLLPQRSIGEDTSALETGAPRTWAYLNAHAARLDARKSSIYRGRPRFSIFGIGDYSFSRWKIAISGLYKRLRFTVVPPRDGKPVLLDDTVYFLPCSGEAEARSLAALLGGDVAADFFRAFLFTDAKRPITAGLLNRLDLTKLADG